MRQGEVPEDLPNIETYECRVCNVSVKYLREHVKNVHKITEAEYEDLFKTGVDGLKDKDSPNDMDPNEDMQSQAPEQMEDLWRVGQENNSASEKNYLMRHHQRDTPQPEHPEVDNNLPKPNKADNSEAIQ